ncbi:endoribonuclease Dicer homolog 2-like protein [Tanacetum coccineum]
MVCVLVIMANNNGNGSSGSNSDVSIDDQHKFSNARSYQIEALNQAIKQTLIVFPRNRSGKTLIAIDASIYADYDGVTILKTCWCFSQLPKDTLELTASPVYTCASESVLAEYISFSTPKYRYYKDTEVPSPALEMIKRDLSMLRERHESKIRNSNLSESSTESAIRRLSRLNSAFEFYQRGETVAREFCKDANGIFSSYIPAGWLTNHINQRSVDLGLLSAKVVCLIEALAEYRHVDDMRCIIFVERVVTAIVLKNLLCELREGKVNIIVATSILEEGLDVQSCNLVIRFNLSSTVCSFIQSRGCARMRNSELLDQ